MPTPPETEKRKRIPIKSAQEEYGYWLLWYFFNGFHSLVSLFENFMTTLDFFSKFQLKRPCWRKVLSAVSSFSSNFAELRGNSAAWCPRFECSCQNRSVLQPSWPCLFNRNLIIVVSSQNCIDKVRQFHWHMSYKFATGISFQIRPNCIFIMLFGFLAIIFAAVKFHTDL